ncbi:hypothetical protein V8G54_024178 [Vigna mungo]|uniref:DUF3755 family protein n=1 Tax=Vigna mungo TaxID=3915 RepID=A0AAQ3N5R5_VIGMU
MNDEEKTATSRRQHGAKTKVVVSVKFEEGVKEDGLLEQMMLSRCNEELPRSLVFWVTLYFSGISISELKSDFLGILIVGFLVACSGVSPSRLHQLNIEPSLGISPLIPVGGYSESVNWRCCFGLKMAVGTSCGLRMAAESNAGFHSEDIDSVFNRRAISFQPGGAINRLSEMVPMGNYFGLSSSSGMIYSGNSTIINSNPVMSQAGNPSSSSLLLDSVPGLKHDTGLAVEWSVDEQYRLEEGLAKYADEPSIMRYIKIAALLPDKTVRDVALRCRWLTQFKQLQENKADGTFNLAKIWLLWLQLPLVRKRRKSEEHNLGKKVHNRKDKPVELASKSNLHSALPPTMATFSRMAHHMDQSQRIQYDGICSPLKQLMEQNAQAFNQITANLSTYKYERDAWDYEPNATTACRHQRGSC